MNSDFSFEFMNGIFARFDTFPETYHTSPIIPTPVSQCQVFSSLSTVENTPTTTPCEVVKQGKTPCSVLSYLDSNKEKQDIHPTGLISIVFRIEWRLGSCEGCGE